MIKEIWKNIKDYGGFYQVSNLGRVKSLPRIIMKSNGRIYTVTGRILKLIKDGNGYLYVNLCRDGKQYVSIIHRLMLNAFIKKPSKKHICNHRDGDKTNNKLTNLEWVTYSENLQHAYKTGLRRNKGLGIKQMEEVKNIYNFGNVSQRFLAKKYSVDQKTIWNIIHSGSD